MDDTLAGISTKNFDLSHGRTGINNGAARETRFSREAKKKKGEEKREDR